MKVQNKVLVVTGGGNGIGRQLVLELLRRGAHVAAVDINENALQETVQIAGNLASNLSTHIVNITDQAAVEALVNQVIKAHGQVDGVINNAGIIQPFVKVVDLNYQQIDRVMNINFKGTLFMTKAFLPTLLQRPEGQIVNLSSMGGFLPVPGQTLYGASKAAVKLFTEGLNSELLNTNVRSTVVFPGAINTGISVNSGVMTKEQQASMDTGKMKMTNPDQAAKIIIDGIEAGKTRILVGSDAKFMDFLYRLNPQRAARFIFNQMGALLK